MKTLADLKRDLSVGTVLEMTYNEYGKGNLLNVPRYVIKANTKGVMLNADKTATKGSTLDFPKKASLCEYDGTTLKIYDAGTRPLTDHEKQILDNKPSMRPENEQAVVNELMTDGSRFYWEDKAYFESLNMEHLRGHETVRGLRYDWNTKEVSDETIKGKLILAYTITK